MTHTRWQELRDLADTAKDAAHNAQYDLYWWLEAKGWKRPGSICGHKWIDPVDGGAFDFEAAVLLQEGRDGKT